MRIVNVVRSLNDLIKLRGLKSNNGKYSLLLDRNLEGGCERISIGVFSDLLGEFIIVNSENRKYFTELVIKETLDLLSNLSFNIQYQTDSAEKIVDDLCETVNDIEERNIKGYLDSLKQIIDRIENLK